mmetsp:Transcript_23690/g.70385  ORF Transcript_23690/g.70385 Transcript_23690/m.70385 type:complete len:220 (-) Transcript_23690:26-685(-)
MRTPRGRTRRNRGCAPGGCAARSGGSARRGLLPLRGARRRCSCLERRRGDARRWLSRRSPRGRPDPRRRAGRRGCPGGWSGSFRSRGRGPRLRCGAARTRPRRAGRVCTRIRRQGASRTRPRQRPRRVCVPRRQEHALRRGVGVVAGRSAGSGSPQAVSEGAGSRGCRTPRGWTGERCKKDGRRPAAGNVEGGAAGAAGGVVESTGVLALSLMVACSGS